MLNRRIIKVICTLSASSSGHTVHGWPAVALLYATDVPLLGFNLRVCRIGRNHFCDVKLLLPTWRQHDILYVVSLLE